MAVKLSVQGTVHSIGPVEKVTEKFSKQVIILDTGGSEGFLAVEFTNKNLEIISAIRVGEVVEVEGYLNSREWKDKWFTSFKGVDCVIVQGSSPAPMKKDSYDQQEMADMFSSKNDDLPF